MLVGKHPLVEGLIGMASKDDDTPKKETKNGVAHGDDKKKPAVEAAKKPDSPAKTGGPAKTEKPKPAAKTVPTAGTKEAAPAGAAKPSPKAEAPRAQANDNTSKPADGPSGQPNGSRSARTDPPGAPGHVPVVSQKPVKQGSLAATLLFGLIGGVVGALLVGAVSGGSGPGSEDVSAIETRIKALEGLAPRVDQAESGLTDQKTALAALKGTTDGNTEPVGTIADMAAKLSGVEQQGKTLAALDSERKRLSKELSRLSADVVALKATVTKSAGGQDALNDQMQGLLKRFAMTEKQLVELAERDSSALRHADLAIAFANLRRVVDRGGAYRSEFDALKALAPADADLSVLAGSADNGVATVAALSQSLRQAAHDALDAEAKAEEGGVVDRILANARSLVKVRKTVPGEGGGTANLLARMSQALDGADLRSAVTDGEKIAGAAAASLKPWLDSAKTRLAVEQGLRSLQGELVGGVADGKAR